MSRFLWSRWLDHFRLWVEHKPIPRAPLRKRYRPQFDLLEARDVPAVFNVTTLSDVVNAGDGVLSLREAIDGFNASADAESTINLTVAGTYLLTGAADDNFNESGDFDLLSESSGHLTINGLGIDTTTIDAQNNDRIFDVVYSANSLTLNDMTLTNGFVRSDGGAVHNRGSTFNANRVEFENNTAQGSEYGGEGRGGAIFSKHLVNITDSVFQSNVARGTTFSGGEGFSSGGNARGGAIYNSNGEVNITNTTFHSNRAEGANGDEYGGGYGGYAAGGAIYNRRGTIVVIDGEFINNRASGGDGFSGFEYGGSFASGGEAEGGAISNDNGILRVEGSAFGGNIAEGGDGHFSGGEGSADGGDAFGGAIYNGYGGSVAILNSTFARQSDSNGNEANGGDAAGTQSSQFAGNGNPGDGFGGALYSGGEGATVEIDFATIAFNSARGGIEHFGSGQRPPGFEQRFGTGFGGGIATGNGAGTPSVRATIVALNRADFGPDVYGEFTSRGSNLIGDIEDSASGFVNGVNNDQVGSSEAPIDPLFGPESDPALEDNGGPTQTLALLPGSPAINAVFGEEFVGEDQRNINRPQGVRRDIGAFEVLQESGKIPLVSSDDPNFASKMPLIPRASSSAVAAVFGGMNAGDAVFVDSLYQSLLGRSADPEGLAGWAGSLFTGNSRQAVVNAIANSVEARTFFVQNLYVQHLGRAADIGGLNGWVAALGAGMSRDDVQAHILSSEEAFQVLGGDPASYVNSLYNQLLGRAADPTGLAAWQGLAGSSVGRFQIVKGILNSVESRTLFVGQLYVSLLNRAADAGGLNAWVGLLNAGVQRSAIQNHLLASDEYYLLHS